ncbi:hypothetical protein F5887DRAFT_971567 [Amanita rubescens]|nr:hypothetical protein F5887DRAFT_971567 [Amanita rubescens]
MVFVLIRDVPSQSHIQRHRCILGSFVHQRLRPRVRACVASSGVLETIMLRATQHPLLFELNNSKVPYLVFPDNRDRQELALDSHPVYEEDDMGQTTVNTNHEIIARDPRFASPLQRIQRLNEALILRRCRNHDCCTRISQNLSTLTRLQREKKEELKQNRRTGAFPIEGKGSDPDSWIRMNLNPFPVLDMLLAMKGKFSSRFME